MTVHFHIHTPMPDQMNERRALFRAARLLHERFGDDPETVLTLVGNIEPQHDPYLQHYGLTQLDGLLLGTGFAAMLEFKNYFHPIQAQSLTGPWYAMAPKGRQPVVGGSRRNPFLQAQHAKRAWTHFFADQPGAGQPWRLLHAFVLFHPYLHPDSHIPPLGENHLWFHVRGVEEICELAFTTLINGWQMSAGQMSKLAHNSLRARTWQELHEELPNQVGVLHVSEPDQRATSVRVFCHSEFTLGRSGTLGHRLQLQNHNVSRAHVRFEVGRTAVRVYDLGSKNGVYLNGRRVDETSGALLQEGDELLLGALHEGATRVWLVPFNPPDKQSDETRTKTS